MGANLNRQQHAGLFAARKRNRLMTSVVDSAAAPAWGTITFSGNPAANDTITINGTQVMFVGGAPSGTQVRIAGDLAGTLNAVVAYFAAHPVNGVGSVSVSGAGLLVLSAKPADTTITIAASAGTVSHGTLQAQRVRKRVTMNNRMAASRTPGTR